MDIQPTNQQPISDDQELAKVLAGVSQQADAAAATPVAEAPEEEAAPAPEMPAPTMPAAEPAEPVMPQPIPAPVDPVMPTPAMPTIPSMPAMEGDGELDTIKKDALNELRPLVDKLNVAPEEKFDTYLLLLRSTDDKALIGPAHEAARNIADEARRAQALLDVIKEIDYLSNPSQAA